MDAPTSSTPSGFRWWKRQQRRRYFQTGIFLILLPAIIGAALYIAGLENYSTGEVLFAAAFLLSFIAYGFYQLVLLVQTYRWQPKQYWFGTILSAHITYLPNRRVRNWNIVAEVNGKQMEAICHPKTYRLAQPGQQILLFTVKGDKLYCVHPEM